MATITKPIILDETGKEIVEAIKALVGGDKEHNLAYQFDAAEANIIGQYRIYNDDLYKCTAPKAAGVPFNLDGWTRVLVMEEIGSGSISISDLADEFSTTKAYNAGDLVRNESGLYKAKTDMAAGGWNPANWEPVAVRDVIVNKNDLNLKNGEGTGSIMGENATSANGANAAAFGNQTAANGLDAFATGYKTEAAGPYAYAEGNGSKATGGMSHAEGRGTIAAGPVQHVQGKYNVEDAAGKYVDIVGGGASPDDRKNIEVTTAEGDKILKGDVYVGADDNSENGILVTKLTDFAPAYDNTVPYAKGDVVIYENKVYKAKDDVAAGTLPTDATKWDEVELKDTISPRAINVPIDDVDKRYDAEEVETALKEISDRTGYYVEDDQVILEHTYVCKDDEWNEYGPHDLKIIPGETYKFTVNGVTKECVAGVTVTGSVEIGFDDDDGPWIYNDGALSAEDGTYNVKLVGKTFVPADAVLLDLPIRRSGKDGSVLIGYGSVAEKGSYAMGGNAKATGESSNALGLGAIASGYCSTAIGGLQSKATGRYALASGYQTTASGEGSHTEGSRTVASGLTAHAEGGNTQAKTSYSHAEGVLTIANSYGQHVQGVGNVEDTSNKFIDIVGSASTKLTPSGELVIDGDRMNAEATTRTGDKIMLGDVYVHAKKDSTGGVKVVSPYDFASDYLPPSTYNKGDVVIYNGGIYKAKEDGITGPWNADKWEQIQNADLFKPRAKDVPIDDVDEHYIAEEVESALKEISDINGYYAENGVVCDMTIDLTEGWFDGYSINMFGNRIIIGKQYHVFFDDVEYTGVAEKYWEDDGDDTTYIWDGSEPYDDDGDYTIDCWGWVEVHKTELAKDNCHFKVVGPMYVKENPGVNSITNLRDGTGFGSIETGCNAATNSGAVSFGNMSMATGANAFTAGNLNSADGDGAMILGTRGTAKPGAQDAFITGYANKANKPLQTIMGFYNVGTEKEDRFGQTVRGTYSVKDTENLYADIVGGGVVRRKPGTSSTYQTQGTAKNIEATTWTGNKKLKGDVYVQCEDDSSKGIKLSTPDVITNFYSETAPYTAGNFVVYDGKLYKAKEDIPAPATGSTRPWDATKWESTNIMSNLSGANVYATDDEVDDMVDEVFGGL